MNKLCKCGCGESTKISWDKKKINDYVNGHGSRGRYRSDDLIEKRQISRIYGDLKRILGIPFDYDYPLCLCGCKQKVKHKNDRFISNHQPGSCGMLGKKFSEETLDKLSKIHTGVKFTEERKNNISKSVSGSFNPMFGKKLSSSHRKKLKGKIPWNKGKKGLQKHSPETKYKMSVSSIKYINTHLRDGKIVRPCIGKNEIPIIDQLESATGLIGISESNTLFLRCGKWPDRYYEKYNLCLDVLEEHHIKPNGELSDNDQNRELLISWKLGCMIYYIPEQEFLTNPEKEIKRFKDFLLLLDQGRN